jgi:hypothetical protein
VYHYHGTVVASTALSSFLACIAYGPYIWLLVILYLLLAYGSSEVLSQSDRETADVVVQALLGGATASIASLWVVDLYSDPRLWRSLQHYVACGFMFAGYGMLTVVTSFDSVIYSPGPSLVLKCILLHIAEVVAVCFTVLSLWILLRESMGNPSAQSGNGELSPKPSLLRPPVLFGRRRFRREEPRAGGGLAQQECKASNEGERVSSAATIDTAEQERDMALAMEGGVVCPRDVLATGSGDESTQSDVMSAANILRDPYHQCQDRDLHVGVLTTGTDEGPLQYEDSVAYFNL